MLCFDGLPLPSSLPIFPSTLPGAQAATSTTGSPLPDTTLKASSSDPQSNLLLQRAADRGRTRSLHGHQDLHRVLLDVRARGGARGRDQEGRGVGGRRGGEAVAGPGDALRRGAGEDERAAQAGGRAGDHPGGARGRRRPPLRLPHQVRHDARAAQGVHGRHQRPLVRAEARRQARRRLPLHRLPGRRPGNHRADCDHPAGAPRHDLRAGGVHVRRRDVRDGGGEGGKPVRCRHHRRRRVQGSYRPRAAASLPPGEILRRDRQEAQGLRLIDQIAWLVQFTSIQPFACE